MHSARLFSSVVRIIAPLGICLTLSCGGSCALFNNQGTQNEPTTQPQSVGEAQTDSTTLVPYQNDAQPLLNIDEPPDETPLLRIAVISDMNGRYGTDIYDSEVSHAVDMIIEDRPDIVINTGDMVAGQKAKLNYRKMWAAFHATVTDRLVAAGIPMAQTPGNHDGSAYPKYANEREVYIDEWNAHRPDLEFVDDSHYPLYYSFTKNGFFFISMDASTMESIEKEQYTWVENQLGNNPSQYGPIVFFHVPLFPITSIKPNEILRDNRLPDLFGKYGVQLVMTGHQHAFFPAMHKGVTYLHTGAIGGGPRPIRQNDGIYPKTVSFINLYENTPLHIETRVVEGDKDKPLNYNLLPTYIIFGSTVLPRVDINIEDAEFARDYMISPHMSKAQMFTLIEALRATGGDWGQVPNWTLDNND